MEGITGSMSNLSSVQGALAMKMMNSAMEVEAAAMMQILEGLDAANIMPSSPVASVSGGNFDMSV